MRALLLFFLFHCFILSSVQSQNFDANLGIGLNAAQIDGDLNAGYNKLGINAGLEVGYNLNESWRLISGLSYQSLGSQKQLQIGSSSPEEQQKIQLTYLSIPLLAEFQINDSGFSIFGGGRFGTLLTSKIQDSSDEAILDFFNQTDIVVSLGVNYRFSEYWSIDLCANEAISLLFNNNKVAQINSNSLRNRYLSFVLKRHL